MRADTPQAMASALSDKAFAMLNGLSRGGGSSSPMLAPMASFSGDAQTLAAALGRNDRTAVANALDTLRSDRANVDATLTAHPGSLDPPSWNALKAQLDQLVAAIGPAAGAAHDATGAASASRTGASVSSAPAPPKVVIEARDPRDGGVHLKGYIEGTELKSAGIYENGQRLRAFKVDEVSGQQRIDLDLGIGSPSPNTVIRVTDADGRFAEAPVLEPDAAAAAAPATGDIVAPEVTTAPVEVLRGSSAGADTGAGVAPPDSGAETADRGLGDSSTSAASADSGTPSVAAPTDSTAPPAALPSADDHANTAEIPSHGATLPSPSKRHTLASKLGNVQINILGVTQTQTLPATYDVVGQISGRGITHAGIYVDGRLVQKIPISDSATYTSFDQHFVMNGGAATIRAYGVGSQFIESSIDLNAGANIGLNVGSTIGSLGSSMPAASGIAVQVTSVRPVLANLYLVSGFITGRNLASAGLYQNGMLAQPIQLNGGIGSILGALTGSGQAVNFNVRFNPAMGTAVIRAFDTSGAYSEAPVMAGGTNPYGGYNPYAGGVSPYGGVTNPYGGVTNPYGAAAAPPGPPNPYYNPKSPYLPTRPTAPPSGPLW